MSARVIVALVVPSYTLLAPVALTLKVRAVMSAMVVFVLEAS